MSHEIVWCIEHGALVELEQGNCLGHSYCVQTEFGQELYFCCLDGGFAYCPPPIVEKMNDKTGAEWLEWCERNQPDYDEQLVMDLQAVSLREELEQ